MKSIEELNIWGFHRTTRDGLNFAEWVIADQSKIRLEKRIAFMVRKNPDMKAEGYVLLHWGVSTTMLSLMLKDLPFTLKKISKRFVSLKYVQHDSYYYEREGLMRDPCCQKDTKVYHILYTTARQRRETIEGIVYGSIGVEPHITGTSMWLLLMSLYRLREKDPFKFVCMIPNASIETIEITGKVVKSIKTQTYAEVEGRYPEKLRELGYELPEMHT